jgi:murein L,D-transpeptidase YafK
MYKNKILSSLTMALVVVSAALPWNATAVNQEGRTSQLLAQTFHANIIESLLAKTLFEIKQGKVNQALNTVEQLIKTTPNFRLAHVIKGDLLASRANILGSFGGQAVRDAQQVQDLKDEAQIRLESYLEKDKEHYQPNLLMELDSKQQYAVVVDVSKSRLFLYAKQDDGRLRYMADYYITIGKNGFGKQVQGDKRTPLGVYFASSKINQPLPDLYGNGAYPLNYPNEYDRHLNKNGSGIWLHGTPTDTYSRPPRASDGCVVLSNPDIEALHPILNKGNTPVIIANNFDWLKANESLYANQKEALNEAIESWRRDWVRQDTDAYLSHYSKQFFYSDGGYQKWADYKRVIQAAKPKVTIGISDVSMFTYPNAERPMVVVNFEQSFKSAALQNTMKKRQYWIHENNQWKIIYEGSA